MTQERLRVYPTYLDIDFKVRKNDASNNYQSTNTAFVCVCQVKWPLTSNHGFIILAFAFF